MATLTINIPDKILAFIDRRVEAGDYENRAEFIAAVIAKQMSSWNPPEPDCYLVDGKIVFANSAQRERLEQKLEEALDEIEHGECTPWKKGDCGRMGREYLKEKYDQAVVKIRNEAKE